MQAIDTLMQEHRAIERVLDALEHFADALATGRAADRAELGHFVRFIREFADRAHHGKEEDVLFTALVDHGFPRDQGPVGVMLAEHDEGRRHVGVLAEIAAADGPVTAAQTAQAVAAAHDFADLLRAHIQKEDQILYVLARQQLPAAVQDKVDARCAAINDRLRADGSYQSLQALGDQLAARHGG